MSELFNNLKQSELSELNEELAKTYFSQSPAKKERQNSPKPAIKPAESKRIIRAVVLVSVALFFIALFVFNRLVINVNVVPLLFSGKAAQGDKASQIPFNVNGEINRDIVKNVMFYGDADLSSGWGKEIVILSNENPGHRAVLGIEFMSPMDCDANEFFFYAKGDTGTEHMRVSFKDSNNNVCHSKVSRLENNWQRFVIDIGKARAFVNPELITHIDVEVNAENEDAVNRSRIYLKEIALIKKGGEG